MSQRQFRSDDTSIWNEKYGNGSDGAASINTSTDAPIDSACTATINTTSVSATNAAFAAGQLILIHQTRGTGAGQWELNKIASYTAGTITTVHNTIFGYVSGAQVIVLPQYSSYTVNSGQTLTAKAWNGTVGGIIAFLCNGTTTITGNITSLATGFTGGPWPGYGSIGGKQGEGQVGAGGAYSTAANGTGGGGGQNVSGVGTGGGAGHAAGGGTGTTNSGAGGGTSGSTDLVTATFGGGGGSGGAWAGSPRSAGIGGIGGGICFIFSKILTITGSISANGQVGGNATTTSGGDPTTGAGGGGAGAGGSVLIKGQTITLGSNLVTAAGAAGGYGARDVGDGRYGGASSIGRIHADYLTSITGTTSPAIDTRQDTSLIIPGGSLFFSHL